MTVLEPVDSIILPLLLCGKSIAELLVNSQRIEVRLILRKGLLPDKQTNQYYGIIISPKAFLQVN
jgi:hypothetical protein